MSSTNRRRRSQLAPTPPRQDARGGEVLSFLNSSDPPMGHRLDMFIRAGCINMEYLHAMTRWGRTEIENFLEHRLSTGGDGLTVFEQRAALLHILSLNAEVEFVC